jgi:hypothetical protein
MRSLFWFLVQPGRQTPGSAFAEMNLRMLVLTGGRERAIDDLLRPRRRRLPAGHRGPHATGRHVIIECVPG